MTERRGCVPIIDMPHVYVVLPGIKRETGPHVVAELMIDLTDSNESDTADSFAGPAARVMTEAELLRDASGRRALDSWVRKDDHWYEVESRMLALGLEPPAAKHVRAARERGASERLVESGMSRQRQSSRLTYQLLVRNQRLRRKMAMLRGTLRDTRQSTLEAAKERRARLGVGGAEVISIRRPRRAG